MLGNDEAATFTRLETARLRLAIAALGATLLASPPPAVATLPASVELPQLVAAADHALVVRVTKVDMVRWGFKVKRASARTGPGWRRWGRTIRLHVAVDEVLFSTARKFPIALVVPLERAFHYSLGQVQDAHSDADEQYVFLLKEPGYVPPFFGVFLRSLAKKDEIVELKAAQAAEP